jgi:hypothetical protein
MPDFSCEIQDGIGAPEFEQRKTCHNVSPGQGAVAFLTLAQCPEFLKGGCRT